MCVVFFFPSQVAHGPSLWVLVWVWGWDVQTASMTSGHRIGFMLKVSIMVQRGSKCCMVITYVLNVDFFTGPMVKE